MRIRTLVSAVALGLLASSALAWDPLPAQAPAPADNPTTAAKVALGKALFFDPRASATGTVSCNSCHNVMAGGDDSRPTSMGVAGKLGGRNAPTVWNAAFQSVQFWDGRAPTLEEQAKGPVANPVEMGMASVDVAMDRVRSIPGYKPMFEAAFGKGDVMTVDNAAKAVAAFERTLITPNSPYDRYVKGDKKALDVTQVRGMETFASAGCTGCHSGANFSGPALAMGQGFYMKFPLFTDSSYVETYGLDKDQGRFSSTQKEADRHLYRVPTLRNIAHTAPYFHNGSVNKLEEAVRVMGKTQLNKDLTDEQVADITAFLHGLDGEYPQMTLPRLPPTPGTSLSVD